MAQVKEQQASAAEGPGAVAARVSPNKLTFRP